MKDKIVGSVLMAMDGAKEDDKISVIIEINLDKGNELLAVKRELEEWGVFFNGITDRYLSCALTAEQIRLLATFNEIKRVWADCPISSYD